MPRPLRIEFENAFFHVMNRGVNHQPVFIENEHAEIFLELISRCHENMGLECHAYCLMSNHYHLLLSTPNANLAECMKVINGQYNQKFNRLTKRDGPLFRGRFKSILIDDQAYLAQVSRYIHRNPIEADLCKNAADYPWSSFKYYEGKIECPPWLQTNRSIALVSSRRQNGDYVRFVHNDGLPSLTTFYGRKKQPAVLGTNKFIHYVKKNYNSPTASTVKLVDVKLKYQVELPKIEMVVQKAFTTAFGKSQTSKLARDGAIYLARTSGIGCLKIQDYFRISSSKSVTSILYRFRQKLERDEQIMTAINQARTEMQNACV
jgi:REP element-mobilizing transposase RayT